MNHDQLDLDALHVPYDTEDTTHFGDYRIQIRSDDMAESPREWDNLGTMVCYHRNYKLGDEHDFGNSRQMWIELAGMDLDHDYVTDAQLERAQELAHKKNIILPLYLYDHSGITMSTTGFSCPWDSGMVGIIFVSLEQVRKEYDWKRITKKRRKQIEEYLTGEVKTYDQYLTGEIYGYIVTREDEDEEVDVDSCWGYYGYDDDYMVSVIKDAIKYDITQTSQQLEMF